MDKINKLKQDIENFQAKTAAKEEIKAFITLVLKLLQTSKQSFDSLSSETIKKISDYIAQIEESYVKWDNSIDTKINTATGQFDANISEIKALIAKVKTIKPRDGVDGYTPIKGVDYFDGEPGLPGKDGSPDTRLQIIEKINSGEKKDPKIELKQIGGLDKVHSTLSENILNRAIGIVDQRTSFLINKVSNLEARDNLDPTTYVPYTGATSDVNLGAHSFTVDTNTLFVDSVNHRVGIGSSAIPSLYGGAKLYVKGTGSSAGEWKGRIVAGGDNVAFLLGEFGSKAWLGAHTADLSSWADFYINPDGAKKLFLGAYPTSSTSIVTIDNATGNVGIGTTNPGGKLEVSGGGNDVTSKLFSGNSSKYSYFAVGRTADELQFGVAGADGQFFTNTSQGDAVLKNFGSGKIHFGVTNGFEIPSAMVLDASGKVGIGTSGPFTGTDNASLNIKGNGSSYNLALTNAANGITAFAVWGGSTNMLWTPQANSFDIQTNSTGKALQLKTNGGSLWLDSTGNVGIGTTSPTAYLHLKAGSATAGTAPIKLTSGTLNTTAKAGAVEFLTNDAYITDTSAIRSPLMRSVYGSMYIYTLGAGATTITVSATDTWYEIGSGVTGGSESNMTFQNNHEIKALIAGKYKIDWALSPEVNAANQEIEGTVMVNGTANTALAGMMELANSNRTGTLTGTGIVTLAVNDVVSLAVLNHTATNNIVISHLTLSIIRVGP